MRRRWQRPFGPPDYATCGRIEEPLTRRVTRLILSTLATIVASCAPAAHYDYAHLPPGYQWRALYNPATNVIVFYGRVPLTNDTVYVGPDSRFYIFHHAGTIQMKDLRRHWLPRDAAPL